MNSSNFMNDFFLTNKHLKSLPSHLLQYIVDQDYNQYTPLPNQNITQSPSTPIGGSGGTSGGGGY